MAYEFDKGYLRAREMELNGGSAAPSEKIIERDWLLLRRLVVLNETRTGLNARWCSSGDKALLVQLNKANSDFVEVLSELNSRTGKRFSWV